MVDYQKLFILLYNSISKAIEILSKAQDQAFEEFVNLNPPKEEVVKVMSKLNL